MSIEPIRAGDSPEVRPAVRLRGAVYARYSSRLQHSIKDQLRGCLEWANHNGIIVSRKHIFRDKAVSGKRSRRRGFRRLLDAIAAGEVDVVIVFSTSRLFRKMYKALQFVEETIVEKGLRCVFVYNNIDTAEADRWRQALAFSAMMDEFVIQSTIAHIQAAHMTLLLDGRVYGTLCFGYTGEPIPGLLTRRGKPGERVIIDPVESPWVRRIFEWFVRDGISIEGIVRRLNTAGAPLPPKVINGRWTYLAVRNLLSNARYHGEWAYGRNMAVWQASKDYIRQIPRDKALRTVHVGELRIIDDETWFAAQKKLQQYRDRAGRLPRNGNPSECSRIPNGLFVCPTHRRSLTVYGTNGLYLACPVCRTGPDRGLYSMLPRKLALQLLCRKLAEVVRDDTDLVRQVIAACRQHADSLQQPDLSDLESLKHRIASLTRSIDFVLRAPGETEQDLAENHRALQRLRAERSELERQIATIKAAVEHPPVVPTDAEVRTLLDQLASTLLDATKSNTPRDRQALRDVIFDITGGHIVVTQQGERKAQRGWLRGTFCTNLLNTVLAQLGCPQRAGDGIKISVDFKEPAPEIKYATLARRLFDNGLLIREIGEQIGIPRSLAVRAIKHAFAELGQKMPDGRTRRASLPRKHVQPPHYQRIADEVARLCHEGRLLADIAEQLGVDRNTVTQSIRWWHESRGLSVPDGRLRRKTLRVKTRKPYKSRRAS